MSEESKPRDEGNWADPVDRLTTGGRNVAGRRVSGAMQGFGQMWQKTYRIAVPGDDPAHVIAVWKEEYGRFWPSTNRFSAPLAGIRPGEVGRIDATTGPARMSTGVLVVYADDTSFTYMTPEGHPFAGWITFSSFGEDGQTYAQVQALVRANDPLFEVGFMLFGNRQEDRMWQHTLRSLAEYLGGGGEVETKVFKVDRRRQWKRIGNIRYNSLLRSMAPRRRGS